MVWLQRIGASSCTEGLYAHRSECLVRHKHYPPMLTDHNPFIHGGFWLNSNQSSYFPPTPAVFHPPNTSMISAGHRAAHKRSWKLCLNECTMKPSGTRHGPASDSQRLGTVTPDCGFLPGCHAAHVCQSHQFPTNQL